MHLRHIFAAAAAILTLGAQAQDIQNVTTAEGPCDVVLTQSVDSTSSTLSVDICEPAVPGVPTDCVEEQIKIPGDYVYETARVVDMSRIAQGRLSNGSSWDVIVGGLGLGFSTALNQPEGLAIEGGKSFEINWLHCLGVGYRNRAMHTEISVGVGVDWRNYRLTTPVRFVADEGVVGLDAYPEGVIPRNSRLKVFSIQFPILWQQGCGFKMLGSEFTLTAGAILNYNTHASLRTVWTDARGVDVANYIDRIGQRKFTVDLIGIVRVCPIAGFYVRWSPMKVLNAPGLQFNPLSAGVMLLY